MGDEATHRTTSNIGLRAWYEAQDLQGWEPSEALGAPGEFPFTRGIHPSMYRRRLPSGHEHGLVTAAVQASLDVGICPDRGETFRASSSLASPKPGTTEKLW
jgi:hypothetical protein